MESQEVLSHPPLLLTQEQRESYFENGYLLLENFVNENILNSLNKVTHNFIIPVLKRTAFIYNIFSREARKILLICETDFEVGYRIS